MRKLLLALTLLSAPAMANIVNVPISQYRDYTCEELIEDYAEWRKASLNALLKAVHETPARRNQIPNTKRYDDAREEAEAHIRTIQRAAKRIDCELMPEHN